MTENGRTEHPHIVQTPNVVGGEPRIEDTRIGVRQIASLLRSGETAEEIIATFPHLKPAAVYDAISYYLDHVDEVDALIAEATPERFVERYGAVIDERGTVHFPSR